MWWIATALAVPPDKQVANLVVGEAQLDRFVTSPDGRFVTGRDERTNAENAWVLDIDTWTIATTEPCRVGGVGVRAIEGTEAADLWIACSDGTLRLERWEEGVISPVDDDQGVPISIDVADGLASAWYAAFTDRVYALSYTGDAGVVYVFDPETQAVESTINLSAASGYETLAEGVVSLDGVRLMIAHGAGRVTSIELGSHTMSTDTGFFALTDPLDVTPSLANGIYALDGEGRLAEYQPLGNQWLYLTGIAVADLQPHALVYNPTLGDEWMVVFGDVVRVWTLSNGVFDDTEPHWESGELLNLVHDGIATDNYVFGGGEGGGLRVITARPWVEPTSISVAPSAAITGESVSVTFTVDEDVDWALHLGGDRSGSGPVLVRGTALAGIETAAVATVSATWVEGANRLYVIATDPSGLTGHGAVSVTVDNPPSVPTITESSLGFAGSRLILAFDGIVDADLDHYDIYVSETPFTAAEYPTGGPKTEILDVTYPVVVTAEPGVRVDQQLYPLVDGTEYWVAVRSVDAGGQESAMSTVVSEFPREGLNAAETAGEVGGGPCSTGPTAPWAALGLIALAVRRARRPAALLSLALPGIASATDEREHWWNAHDLSQARGNFEIRYGSVNFEDPAITDVYDRGAKNVLAVEAGPQIARFFEVDLGLGFIQELATTESDGVDSVEKTMLTAWPLTCDGTLRIHVLDEQVVVPHVRFGVDYLVWNEIDDSVDFTGKDKIHGTKLGTHWAVGGGLLLDVFAPRRASLLEAQSGINDTWVVAEFRKQAIDDREAFWKSGSGKGLDFTGTSFTVGVKLDY